MLHILVFYQLLATARRNRITFGTQMNQHSSRSHALLCITIQGTDLATGSKTTGQLSTRCLFLSVSNVFLKVATVNLNPVVEYNSPTRKLQCCKHKFSQ